MTTKLAASDMLTAGRAVISPAQGLSGSGRRRNRQILRAVRLRLAVRHGRATGPTMSLPSNSTLY